MVLDPSYIKHGVEPTTDCKLFYPDAKKEFPADAPTPLGNDIQITCFIDVDHPGDLITQHLETGVLAYLNREPVKWYSKKQISVDTSTVGSNNRIPSKVCQQTKQISFLMSWMDENH